METFESTAVGFDFADQFLNLNAGSTQVAAADYQHPESTQLYGESSDFVSSPVQQPSTTDLGFLLNLPEEGAGLEWISQFLEDSFSQFYYPITETASPPAYTSSSLTESTTSSSPSSSATSSMCCPTSPSTPLAFHDRKQRKKKKGRAGGGPLRCSHCGIEKTPQWRAGPMGAKTLCNACGVRFKSGRLLPEYRPACSPTFSTRLHSNSHRKIMEMRRKKEMVELSVFNIVKARFASDRTLAAALLCLHFHDCFVRRCDASILLDGGNVEKNAGPNGSVRGYELIDTIKAALERACPGVFSCADIIAMATKVVVSLSGGGSYRVETERRDGVISMLNEASNSLEWISHFLEGSFSQFYYPIPETASPPAYTSSLLTESTTSSSPSSSATSSMCWPTSPSTPLGFHEGKQRKKKKDRAGGGPLRCSHCGIEKTPQWRAGPMGAKTLCNAFGVRFKSGRLLPEYRPACSPMFSSRLHSNSHRKVMEMRRKKEMVGQTETGG